MPIKQETIDEIKAVRLSQDKEYQILLEKKKYHETRLEEIKRDMEYIET